MKPTKRIEAEVLDVYQKWLHSYLNGDVATYNSYFDDAFHFIGSTNNEEFLTRKDTTNFFKVTAEQLAGKTQLRNETKIVEQFGELVFITHLFDAWFLNGNDWSFYGRFRFSNILEQNKNGWHFVYQHYSTPDSKAQDGETIGYNQITKENLELREAIQRGTIELESRNRELEIEGALARIRAQAVAMQQSTDLLDIVVTMRNEFTKLGHEAHYFWHMMWLPETYEKAMTSGDGSKIGFVMNLPRHIHGDIPLLAKWEKSKKPTVVYAMDADEAIDYVDKMVNLGNFQSIDPQAPSHDDIRHIGGLTFIMARTTHGEIGYSLPGVVKNPPEEDLDILVQFAGAFDLAHQRFLDLQKAEKQAREVQIELALEKVRSRTMAMQRSEELADVSSVLFQQVKELGIEQWTCGFNIWETGDTEFKYFPGGPDGKMLPSCMVPLMEHPVFREFVASRKRGDDLMVYEKEGDIQKDHYKYMLSLPGIGDMLQGVLDQGMEFPDFQIDHIANFAYGNIVFITYQPVPEMHDVFKRFAKVFEQTYTRFLDLQKAETQAKEAQIEAALERVRSRSMAMHYSEELTEAGALLYQELSKLGIQNLVTGYTLFDETATLGWNYGVNPMDGSIRHKPVGMNHSKNKVMKTIATSWKKQEPLLVIELNEKETIKHQTFIAEESIGFPISKEKLLSISPKNLVIHTFNFKQGYLLVVGGDLLRVEQREMITRFAKVFQQTYTRFLDLQKAEKQARESEIELALERVRARTMAMQKSEEIGQVAQILFQQLKSLGGELWGTGFGLCEINSDVDEYWFANEKGIMPRLNIPNNVDPAHKQMYEGWKKNLELLSITKGGKELKEHYKYMLTVPDVQSIFQGMLDNGIAFPKWQKWHAAYFKYGYLLVITTEEYKNEAIFNRFAKVFEQAYTRFLDLQKAEAQTKEAQIEAALERVRSRSMAMHNSDELKDVIKVIFDQMGQLKINADHAGIVVDYEPKKDFHFWVADHQDIPAMISVPYLDLPWDRQFTEAKKKGTDFFITQLDFEEKNSFYKKLLPHIKGLTKQAKDFYLNCPGLAASTVIQKDIGLYIENFSGIPFSDEDNSILKRFGKVYQQTYTRFLDLQKAEAQAKEARIEAALERTRTQSMLMQHSDELDATSKVFHEQLQLLGIDTEFSYVWLPDEAKNEHQFWVAWNSEKKGSPLVQSKAIVYPLDKTEPYTAACFKDWASEISVHIHHIEPSEVKNFFTAWEELLKDAKKLNPKYFSNGLYYAEAFMKYGCFGINIKRPVSDEEKQILHRFSVEFERTYTRFLDLQKAEAQAREAQIETALERVRSRSMAMHSSEELTDAGALLYQELSKLGIQNLTTGYTLFDETVTIGWNYGVNPYDGSIRHKPVGMYHTKTKVMKAIASSWKKQEPLLVIQLNERETIKHQTFIADESIDFPISKERLLSISPKRLVVHTFNFKQGYLLIVGGVLLTFEQQEIISRFANVFQQTYTRFLDLQKAEAQAREAQIEASLERVRSRSMAMQKSSELLEAGELLWNEITKLDINCFTSGYVLMDDNEDIGWNYTPNPSTGKILEQAIGIPHKQTTPMRKIAASWKTQEPICVIELTKKETIAHQTFVAEKGINFPFSAKQLVEISPEEIVLHTFNFKQGYLLIVGDVKISKDQIHLMLRFTKVFQQTYTRFLDLKKAEAQTREAQIEMALEKVRSRTMAMQKGEEVKDVGVLLYKELIALGVTNFATCGYVEINEETKRQATWVTSPGGDSLGLFHLPLTGDVHFDERYEAWKKQQTVFHQTVTGKERRTHLEYAITTFNSKEAEQMVLTQFPDPTVFYCFNFSHGYLHLVCGSYLNKEEESLLARFARVFEQTYARFLDLKNAEAQAREAQIEAALERVRSRSMAMHKSDELLDVISVVSEQLKQLGFRFVHVSFANNDDNKSYRFWTAAKGLAHPTRFETPNINIAVFNNIKKAQEKSLSFFSDIITKEEHWKWHKHLLDHGGSKIFSKEQNDVIKSRGMARSIAINTNIILILANYASVPYSEEDNKIIERFAKVFEQSYTRFLDLQKAEAQTREGQINLAVERVRAKALAMHKSEEIIDVVAKLKDEVMALDIPDVIAATIFLKEGDDKVRMWDLSTLEKGNNGYEIPFDITFKLKKRDPNLYIKRVWENAENYFLEVQEAKDLKRIIAWLRENNKDSIADEVEEYTESAKLERLHHAVKKLNNGKLVIDLLNTPTDEMETILTKMGGAFDLAYKRFEDLQKAETQTREAQIEAALERVRAASLGMHKSEDHHKIVTVVFKQLEQLGVSAHSAFISENIEDRDVMHFWVAANGQVYPEQVHIPVIKNPIFSEFYKAFDNSIDFITDQLSKKEKNQFFIHYFKKSNHKDVPEERQKFILSAIGLARSTALFKNTALTVLRYEKLDFTKEENSIIKRIGAAFDQSYTRFLDLQKAEAQTREAQIEAALERVRARSMAMQRSEELPEVALVLWEQLKLLKLEGLDGCAIHVYDDKSGTFDAWTAFPDLIEGERKMKLNMFTSKQGCIWAYEEWDRHFRAGEIDFCAICNKPQLNEFIDWFAPHLPLLAEEFRSFNLDTLYVNGIAFSNGILGAPSLEPLSVETGTAFKRLAAVFDLAYRRFADLQKAEAQARESKIEAALERLRSRSMAMQYSSELNLILAKVFEELTSLELEMERAVIWTYNPEDRSVRWWAANPEMESGSESFFIANQDDPVYNEYWKAWEERRTKYLYILEGGYKEDWTDILFNKTELGQLPEIVKAAMVKPEKIYLYNTFNDFGVLFIACLEPLSDDKFTILQRFGKVFDQSYTRFKDIKQAEARALEAIKQSSLDRVRGQIASMRSTADLDRITPLVWDELTTLGVPFIRCGVFIVDEATETVQVYLSAPDGHSLGVMHMPFTANELTSNAVAHWRKAKVYKAHWGQKQFIEFMQTMIDLGQIKNKKTYQGAAKPPVSLDLHFVPFTQGMLYVGSDDSLVEEQVELVQSLADAFAIAYARYEDFIQLEKAKQSIEITLTELKATQSQLIQSEKMASLGELTAGIAHEIQNPLNFVNNFSEVSKELLQEMQEEIENGDFEEVKAIMNDVIQNLEKINHHGKRADGIVKGMLQHSRSSTAEKEPTDINKLADEYLRLAYHGLRAKEKSFNATLETNFDASIGKVYIIPQDMGRVILNLITNAFYVVNEKKQQKPKDYEPTVSVSTKKIDDKIEIKVTDNGNGIPKHVIDKVFQPFFTTKPTGQGTGLGLSMSYDIVTKGHGGELKVETEENEGTTFSVVLPIAGNFN